MELRLEAQACLGQCSASQFNSNAQTVYFTPLCFLTYTVSISLTRMDTNINIRNYLTSRTPSLIMRVAIGAWPWPKDRAWNRVPIPLASANCSRAPVGSTPGDNTKMSGERVVESSTTCFISNTGGSTNLEPRLLTMKDVTQNETRSCRRDRVINIFCSSLHALSHSPEVMWRHKDQWKVIQNLN